MSVMDRGRFGPEIRRLDRRQAIGASQGDSAGGSRLAEVSACGHAAWAVSARYIAFGASPNRKPIPAPNKRSKAQYFAFIQVSAGRVERGMLVLRLRGPIGS